MNDGTRMDTKKTLFHDYKYKVEPPKKETEIIVTGQGAMAETRHRLKTEIRRGILDIIGVSNTGG